MRKADQEVMLDIAARVGGDEFLIFLEYKDDVDAVLSRIFQSLCGRFEQFPLSVSMGAALTATVLAGKNIDSVAFLYL